ncbi:MAG: UDP-N-acetylmuramate dehydrogenase [Patescibacteria group bacterium]
MDTLEDLDINLYKKVRKNVPLAPYTTFKIGGPARYFFGTDNEKELVVILKFCKIKNIPYFVLGGGSNILVSDKGFEGLVIKILDTRYKIQDTNIEAGAGALISKLILETKKQDLSGLEYLTGLPGTLGGAIFGNAGSTRFGREIGDLVKKAKLLFPDGKIKEVSNNWFEFSYRHSHLKDFKDNERPIVLSAILKLKRGTKKNIEKRMNEINTIRTKNLPKGFCAGCVFKNIEIANLHELPANLRKLLSKDIIKGNKNKGFKIPAGWLIEQCGLKGKKIGNAVISEQHANFIINENRARARDIKKLIDLARKKVFKKFNIHLEDENILVGF